jgi:hypothetical protein
MTAGLEFSGEPLVWPERRQPPEVDGDVLRQACRAHRAALDAHQSIQDALVRRLRAGEAEQS